MQRQLKGKVGTNTAMPLIHVAKTSFRRLCVCLAELAKSVNDTSVTHTHTYTRNFPHKWPFSDPELTATAKHLCHDAGSAVNLSNTNIDSLMLPAAEVMSIHHIYAKLPEQHRQALDRGQEKLFRGATAAAIWQEGRRGGGCPCVKSLLREAKSDGRLTLRGTGKESRK